MNPFSAMLIIIKREMTITHKDFFRLLPRALRDRGYTVSGGRISVEDPDGMIDITLSGEKTRSIASLKLPVTDIEFVFKGFTQDQVDAFMKSFDLSYQKGGG